MILLYERFSFTQYLKLYTFWSNKYALYLIKRHAQDTLKKELKYGTKEKV